MNTIKEFGNIARDLVRNPLGIIALFIVLIYGFATLLVGASNNLEANDRFPIVWFLVIFPVIVLFVFAWLVSRHHKKLYAPSDYKDESNFLDNYNPNLKSLEYARPDIENDQMTDIYETDQPNIKAPVIKTEYFDDINKTEIESTEEWSKARIDIYSRNRGCFITHVLRPSNDEGQMYEISIYLIRHKSEDYNDILKTEFFFGHYWGNKVFEGTKIGKLIGVKTSAYGPFLALCKITFKDGASVLLNKYIDFEMGFAVNKLFN